MIKSRVLSAITSLALASGFSPNTADAEDCELENRGSLALTEIKEDLNPKIARISRIEGQESFIDVDSSKFVSQKDETDDD